MISLYPNPGHMLTMVTFWLCSLNVYFVTRRPFRIIFHGLCFSGKNVSFLRSVLQWRRLDLILFDISFPVRLVYQFRDLLHDQPAHRTPFISTKAHFNLLQ